MWQLIRSNWEWIRTQIPGGAVSAVFLMLFAFSKLETAEVRQELKEADIRHDSTEAAAYQAAAEAHQRLADAIVTTGRKDEEIRALKVRLFFLTADSSLLYRP